MVARQCFEAVLDVKALQGTAPAVLQGYRFEGYDRTIDSHIKRLRKKFRDVDSEFSEIETLYGVGYRFKETP